MTNSVKEKNSELVAKRWAKALIDLAEEDSNISKQDILDDLKEVQATIDSSEELASVIVNPAISTEEKQVILCKLFQNSLLPIVYNFVYVLNLRKRVQIIGDIAAEFEKELNRLNNITHVEVTSAIELNEDKKAEIKSVIASKLSKDVTVNWGVDSEIIAGLIFNIDETVIDNSVRHKLEDLSRSIMR